MSKYQPRSREPITRGFNKPKGAKCFRPTPDFCTVLTTQLEDDPEFINE